jgi:rubrerythrin
MVTRVVRTVADRLSDRPAYVCEFCGEGYDRGRSNCPACGFDVVPR